VQQSSKKYVFKRGQKTGSDGADVLCCGRLFQIRTAATGNARSPSVERLDECYYHHGRSYVADLLDSKYMSVHYHLLVVANKALIACYKKTGCKSITTV